MAKGIKDGFATVFATLLFRLLFYPEDGGSTFLGNVSGFLHVRYLSSKEQNVGCFGAMSFFCWRIVVSAKHVPYRVQQRRGFLGGLPGS
jgi:hypothetical protein